MAEGVDSGPRFSPRAVPGEFREPAEMISFYQDDGYRLEGDLYVRPGAEPRAGIVFCNGWGGSRKSGVLGATIATGLTDRIDCVVLDFDYSGRGGSEGPRNRLDPFRQVHDARCAVSWMLQRYPSLRGHVGLYGSSFGAGIATVAAAMDLRVGALVAVSGYSSGEAFLRDMRAHWQFVLFKEELERDRLARVVGGRSKLVDPDNDILVRDPESAAYNQEVIRKNPARRFEVDLVSADLVMEFDVVRKAGLLRGRRALMIHAERDLLIPWQQSEKVAKAAGGRFVLLPGVGHYELYTGEPLTAVLDHAAAFFLECRVPEIR